MENETLATIDEMLEEAAKRLKFFGMPSRCISEMKKGKPWFSEGIGSYEMDNEKELIQEIKEFELEHGYIVYHAIHNMYEFGECWSLLYVSNRRDEWESDHNDIQDGYTLAYVWNKDYDYDSEFGDIGVRGLYGAIHRLA